MIAINKTLNLVWGIQLTFKHKHSMFERTVECFWSQSYTAACGLIWRHLCHLSNIRPFTALILQTHLHASSNRRDIQSMIKQYLQILLHNKTLFEFPNTHLTHFTLKALTSVLHLPRKNKILHCGLCTSTGQDTKSVCPIETHVINTPEQDQILSYFPRIYKNSQRVVMVIHVF